MTGSVSYDAMLCCTELLCACIYNVYGQLRDSATASGLSALTAVVAGMDSVACPAAAWC